MKITPSFIPEETLLREWGVSPLELQLLAAEGLQLSLYPLNGEQVQGVTLAEKRRFERFKREREAKGREPIQHGSQRKGDRMLIAMMALAFFAEDQEFHDDDTDRPYKLIKQIAEDVRTVTGLLLPRSEESDANAIKEGLQLLRERGWRPRKARALDAGRDVEIKTLTKTAEATHE